MKGGGVMGGHGNVGIATPDKRSTKKGAMVPPVSKGKKKVPQGKPVGPQS